jgi:3-dehydroquinate synthase
MEPIIIQAGQLRCEVFVGRGLLQSAGALISEKLKPSVCAIVSDEKVGPLFARPLMENLTSNGFAPMLITVPSGEGSKNLTMVESVCNQMSQAGLDRSSILIALGGGVIGDLAGFVAAVFLRGIRYVQIPTTLLAQVDSSIGGKTGVNTTLGKNMIGAWHHPALVIVDTETLTELPPRELKQGFAEIIKDAIIRDADLFATLENFDQRNLEAIVRRCVEIKGAIVAVDERETKGERAILNFGHTVGHAIERAGEYRKFAHGEAVSLGMVVAAAISSRKAGLSERDRERIVRILQAFDLPTQLPANFPREKILEAIRFDKKFERQAVRFVVTPTIGSAHVTNDVTMKDIETAISQL